MSLPDDFHVLPTDQYKVLSEPDIERERLRHENDNLREEIEALRAEIRSLKIQRMTMVTAMQMTPADLKSLKELAVKISELFDEESH